MEKKGRATRHTPAFCIYLKVLPHLQQGPIPKSSAPGLPSPVATIVTSHNICHCVNDGSHST